MYFLFWRTYFFDGFTAVIQSPVIQSVAKHVIQRAYNARRNSWKGFISWEGHRIHATA